MIYNDETSNGTLFLQRKCPVVPPRDIYEHIPTNGTSDGTFSGTLSLQTGHFQVLARPDSGTSWGVYIYDISPHVPMEGFNVPHIFS